MWNNNDLDNIFLKRKSVRELSSEMIDEDTINEIIKIGLLSPMAGGLKSVFIKEIKNDNDKKICYKASFYQEHVKNAPHILLIGTNKNIIGEKYSEPYISRFAEQNCAASAMNMINYCSAINLSTCYIGGIRRDVLSDIFSDETVEPVVMLLVGKKVA